MAYVKSYVNWAGLGVWHFHNRHSEIWSALLSDHKVAGSCQTGWKTSGAQRSKSGSDLSQRRTASEWKRAVSNLVPGQLVFERSRTGMWKELRAVCAWAAWNVAAGCRSSWDKRQNHWERTSRPSLFMVHAQIFDLSAQLKANICLRKQPGNMYWHNSAEMWSCSRKDQIKKTQSCSHQGGGCLDPWSICKFKPEFAWLVVSSLLYVTVVVSQ